MTPVDEKATTGSGEQARLRSSYVQTGRLPLGQSLALGLRDLIVQPIWLPIKYLPGVVGMKLRQWIFRCRLGAMGRHSLIDAAVEIPRAARVRIGDFTLIGKYCQLNAADGTIEIGDRCHLAGFVTVLGHGGVVIEDYVGVAAGARIYSASEWPADGKRLAGPMVPDDQRSVRVGPVRLCRDSFLGANSVVLPGVTIGQGAVVGANSLVARDVPPWTIVLGVPAIPVGQREPVRESE